VNTKNVIHATRLSVQVVLVLEQACYVSPGLTHMKQLIYLSIQFVNNLFTLFHFIYNARLCLLTLEENRALTKMVL
jgi:hypothetical protein